MILVGTPPRVGDTVQAGLYSLVTGTLVWLGVDNASVDVGGCRIVFPRAQVLMLSERQVNVFGPNDPHDDVYTGPIERAGEALLPGSYYATSLLGDQTEHRGFLKIDDDGQATWCCHWRCLCQLVILDDLNLRPR